MTTWLDWHVRSRLMAEESQPEIARHLQMGAPDPISAFADSFFEMLAERTVDAKAFAEKVGDAKLAEEIACRVACMAPFLWGFASPETRKTLPQSGPPVGLLLTRDTASLLSNADPPQDEWRRRTFGSGPGEEGLSGVYVDVPHGALRIGDSLQIRTLFAVPWTTSDSNDILYWTGALLVHVLVTKAGSEHECGSIFVVVNADDTITLAAIDEHTPLGGLDTEEATDGAAWVTLYRRIVENAVRFLRLVLAYRRYGPSEVRQSVRQTPAADAISNRFRPRKTESLFAITRLNPARDRLGRAAKATPASWSMTAQQEVSGHFKLQPHGPARTLRKLIWIDSYPRGPEGAPIKPRAVAL